ncbi:MAG: hypothetical protein PHF56_00330 [Desulfuromonadaceae bacterium]|nr:hypothetical protein [Desulfuromonadaceae bacterium]
MKTDRCRLLTPALVAELSALIDKIQSLEESDIARSLMDCALHIQIESARIDAGSAKKRSEQGVCPWQEDLPEHLHSWLQSKARQEGVSINTLATTYIAYGLTRDVA